MRSRIYLASLSGLAMFAMIGADAALAAKAPAGVIDCFADLMSGKSAEIVCEFPVEPSPQELEELAKSTRGYLKDVHCMVSIRIPRADVMAAITNPDHVFQAPPQPVACELEANLSKDQTKIIAVGGTFAPRVVFKGGVAVEATPGLANVQGVTRVLSYPVELWVNRGAMVRDGMLTVVNAWVSHMRGQRPKTARR
jgi:hypothetical protein